MRGYAGLGEGTAMGYEAARTMHSLPDAMAEAVRAKQAWIAEQCRGSVEVDRRSEVERALEEQSGAIDRLSSAVAELRARLAPVLRDEPPATDPSGPRQMPSVMVAQGIAVRTDEIDRLANMVGSMICRLGV